MFEELKRILLLTGHYGCGKTNFAVNLALHLKEEGEDVAVIDLDIVNPYFRTADFSSMLTARGVNVVTPRFANSLLDIPSLSRSVAGAFFGDGRVVADVGGDDAGAVALGRYHADILGAGGADMLYLFSVFRPGAGSPEELLPHIAEIEAASRQRVSYLVNASNLAGETVCEDVSGSLPFAEKLSELSGIPLLATLALPCFSDRIAHSFAVRRFVRPVWEK